VEINKIYNENCLDTMRRMPDNFVDLTITSPPYNMKLKVQKGKYQHILSSSPWAADDARTKYCGDFEDSLPIEDFYKLHSEIVTELLRVSKMIFYNISIVAGSKRAFFKIIGEYSDFVKEIIIWDKGHGQPAISPGVLNRQSELIIVFDNSTAINRTFYKCNFDRGTLSDVWKIARGKKISKDHGAVFPEELVQKIIENFSDEGDLIYDPFMGTGTTGHVASLYKRNYIGSEISKNYCKVAEERIWNPLLELIKH
jgi:site-specific DNA-methyltransferase (adenine-specific)/modification methylase